MFRRRFSRRPRRAKRRTRWVSITPGAFPNFTSNDVYEYEFVGIQDAVGSLSWSEFYGGTILRTLLEITVDPVYGTFDGADDESTLIWHYGVFVTPGLSATATPDEQIWDPNVPSGDFMHRGTWVESLIKRNNVMVVVPNKDGHNVTIDSTVKRRIGENDAMWMTARYFERNGGTGDATLQVGYSGRILIALP